MWQVLDSDVYRRTWISHIFLYSSVRTTSKAGTYWSRAQWAVSGWLNTCPGCGTNPWLISLCPRFQPFRLLCSPAPFPAGEEKCCLWNNFPKWTKIWLNMLWHGNRNTREKVGGCLNLLQTTIACVCWQDVALSDIIDHLCPLILPIQVSESCSIRCPTGLAVFRI